MLINEVCKECKLTKKAIEYYEGQRLVEPQKLENGYRDFSNSEIEQFIPAMKKLSQSYRNYHEAMQRANEVFIGKYPNAGFIDVE